MKVSILIVAYNAERYISECIESVIAQTHRDFEAIIVDDGSTDKTPEIISKITDKRFRLYRRHHDYISSLNFGLRQAKGTYIARMDADDIMLPTRLEEQVYLMNSQPDIDVCCSWASILNDPSNVIGCGTGRIQEPLAELLINNMFIHPSSMIKKDFLMKHNLNYKNYPYAEDYKLWLEIAKKGGIFWVIPKPLIKYRVSDNQVSNIYCQEQHITALRIRNEVLLAILNNNKVAELDTFQSIYIKLEHLNKQALLSSGTILNIVYVIYKEIKQNIVQ